MHIQTHKHTHTSAPLGLSARLNIRPLTLQTGEETHLPSPFITSAPFSIPNTQLLDINYLPPIGMSLERRRITSCGKKVKSPHRGPPPQDLVFGPHFNPLVLCVITNLAGAGRQYHVNMTSDVTAVPGCQDLFGMSRRALP